jgi:putative transposase
LEMVRISPLTTLSPSVRRRLYQAQQEAARVWTVCRDLHLAARQQHRHWPERDDLQVATKGQFALHSQTVQMICQQFLANVDATRELQKTNRRIRYPYKHKRFFPLYWPAQAVSVERGLGERSTRIVLPMGRGRRSLVFKLDLPEIGSVKLVWKNGYELHVCVPATPAETTPGPVQATVDLGEIHQAAVTTNTSAALVVSGRGIRSLKRRHHMALGQLARKRSRCQKGSRRYLKLQRARRHHELHWLRAGNEQPVSGMRLETESQRTGLALPQSPVLLCGAPGCGRECQHAPAGLWEENYIPRSHHVSTSRSRAGPDTE